MTLIRPPWACGVPVERDWGPLYSRMVFEDGAVRTRYMGPFFERIDHPEGNNLHAVRPLYSKLDEPEMDRIREDYVWPLASSRHLGQELSRRILLVYTYRDHGNPARPYKFWVIPFYFQGRSKDGDSYGALFPLGGTIRDFLYRDYLSFVLWPIYSTSAVSAIESHSILWPIYSKTDGGKVYRRRVFPFYGINIRKDQYTKRFVMWPFYTSSAYHGPRQVGTAWILFPLYGRVRMIDQQSTMILPPFFRWDRAENLHRIHAPWPLVNISSGETDRKYFWPFWGRRRIGQVRSGFFLWPFMRWEDIIRTSTHYGGYRFFPFVQNWKTRTLDENGKPGEILSLKQKLWPFYAYEREGDDMMFRMVALNSFRQWQALERNWAPLWTVYSKVQRGEDLQTEVLWGLYRDRRIGACYRRVSLFPLVDWTRDDRSDQRSWNLLKGFVGYRRQGENRGLRLLYVLKFGAAMQESDP